MKLKSLAIVVLILFFASSLVAGEKEFKKGTWYLTPQVALYSYALNFGANLEMALTENIGVGGNLMLAFWSEDFGAWGGLSQTLITPSVEVLYHFIKIPVAKLDVFAGASLGFSIYSYSWDVAGVGDDSGVGSSSLFLSPVAGARYWFSEKLAACLKVYFSAIGDFSSVGGVVGLTFILKK